MLQALALSDGSGCVVVNDGIGTADLLVPEPVAIGLHGARFAWCAAPW